MEEKREESKNIEKYNIYHKAFTLMNLAKQEKNLPYSIASIAIAESIIADRTLSYISFKEKEWYERNNNKYINTASLIDKCNKYFKKYAVRINRKDSSIYETKDLFQDLKNWLNKRNTVLHSFAKSKPGTKTMTVEEFSELAIETSEEGLELVSLTKKWFAQQKRKTKIK